MSGQACIETIGSHKGCRKIRCPVLMRHVRMVMVGRRTRCLVRVSLFKRDGCRVVGMHQDKGRAALHLCGDEGL